MKGKKKSISPLSTEATSNASLVDVLLLVYPTSLPVTIHLTPFIPFRRSDEVDSDPDFESSGRQELTNVFGDDKPDLMLVRTLYAAVAYTPIVLFAQKNIVTKKQSGLPLSMLHHASSFHLQFKTTMAHGISSFHPGLTDRHGKMVCNESHRRSRCLEANLLSCQLWGRQLSSHACRVGL